MASASDEIQACLRKASSDLLASQILVEHSSCMTVAALAFADKQYPTRRN